MSPIKSVFRSGNLPVNRIEAFSDGVIAIIVTILVLEMKVPDVHGVANLNDALAAKLFESIPKLLSYIVSFMVLAVWWVAHHHLIHLLRKADRGVLWLNSLFLMVLALIPFPTAIIGEYPFERVAIASYGAVCIFSGLSFLALRWYITHKSGLIGEELSKEVLDAGLRRSLMSPILYSSVTCLCFIHPAISLTGFALIPFYYVLPGLLERHGQANKPS